MAQFDNDIFKYTYLSPRNHQLANYHYYQTIQRSEIWHLRDRVPEEVVRLW